MEREILLVDREQLHYTEYGHPERSRKRFRTGKSHVEQEIVNAKHRRDRRPPL